MIAKSERKKWEISKYLDAQFNLDELILGLELIDKFKKKYPNDEIIMDMDEIIREEICSIFGGTLED